VSKISTLTAENLCAVNEKVLRAVAGFAQINQRRDIAPIFVIVPDRFTLAAEKILASFAPCLLNCRVVTFSMLFNVLNMGATLVIDKTTGVLFLWRAIQEVRGDLLYFGNSAHQYAFAEKMFNTINQLTSCDADFDKLEGNAKSQITARKMHDIAVIRTKYKQLIGEQIDGAGVLDWLINNVTQNEVIKSAHVYMTGFEYVSRQRQEVFARIARTARSFTVGVRDGSELEGRLNEIRFAL